MTEQCRLPVSLGITLYKNTLLLLLLTGLELKAD